jgi:hypothetical protein
MSNFNQEQFDNLLLLWSDDHVLAIESLFDVTLTNQQKNLVRLAKDQTARVAVSSCTGSGKTSCLSMLTFLYLMILPDCRILITAPTSNHLERVFYAELNKWHRKMPPEFQCLFDITLRRISYKSKQLVHFASLVTASVDNAEALAGGHSDNYIIMADEASGIEESAFDILLGTLSTGAGGRFIQVSNPQRSSGRFFEIFQRDLGSWHKLFFSAFDSPNVNKEWIEEMRDTYGEDSDIYRMRVLGQFPRVGVSQFISSDVIEDAIELSIDPRSYQSFPKLMGCDIARFGDDLSAIVIRQGPKVIDIKTYRGLDTMEVSGKIIELQSYHSCATIFIDSIGVGAGTADRCRQLGLPIKDVVVSNKSTEPNIYSNVRAQLWGKMREWLEAGGVDLPKDATAGDKNLAAQLSSMVYGYNVKMQLQLLSKRDLKKLGYASPDIADALSFTFADSMYSINRRNRLRKQTTRSNYLWV